MRIVYDDTMQNNLINLVHLILVKIPSKSVCQSSHGMMRVDKTLLKAHINSALKEKYFEIGDRVAHANGIGNNNEYPVYWKGNPDEMQECAYISINTGLYGEGFVYLTDYNNKRIGRTYEFNYGRITKVS